MIKRIIVVVGLSILYLSVQAQRSKPMNLTTFDREDFHFGYSVGINWMGFTTIPADSIMINTKQNPGININLITDLRMGKFLSLRFLPGIQFSQRDLHITDSISLASWNAKVESVYLDFPFLVKYRAQRVNNYAPYLVLGINPRVDLTGGEIENWKPVQRIVKAFDVFPELGFGLDFYLDQVKVSTELKFSVGLLNIYNPPSEETGYELFSRAMDKMLSRMIIFAIHIE